METLIVNLEQIEMHCDHYHSIETFAGAAAWVDKANFYIAQLEQASADMEGDSQLFTRPQIQKKSLLGGILHREIENPQAGLKGDEDLRKNYIQLRDRLKRHARSIPVSEETKAELLKQANGYLHGFELKLEKLQQDNQPQPFPWKKLITSIAKRRLLREVGIYDTKSMSDMEMDHRRRLVEAEEQNEYRRSIMAIRNFQATIEWLNKFHE